MKTIIPLLLVVMTACGGDQISATFTNTTTTDSSSSTTTATTETGETATTTVPTTSTSNLAPNVEILLPSASGDYGGNQEIDFLAEVTDDTDTPESLNPTWESDLDGVLDVVMTHGSKGLITGRTALSVGTHVLTLTATDLSGLSGVDTVTIEVGADEPPSCQIIDPSDGYVFASTTLTVVFVGQAEDLESAHTEVDVIWTSDVDGVLFAGHPDSSGGTDVKMGPLTLGPHEIDLHVTDGMGNVCTDSIKVTYGQTPVIVFDKPSTGEAFSVGSSVSIKTYGKDLEDLPEDLDIVWSSSINGVFSNQSFDAGGEASISVDWFSVGTHTLTVTVTDSDGMNSAHSIEIDIY